MGSCFSRKKVSSSSSAKESVKKNVVEAAKEKKDQRFPRNEVFILKHRKSHDRERSFPFSPQITEENVNFSGAITTSSCTKEELDAILIQCGRLSRSNSSSKAVSLVWKGSGSNGSFDFDYENEDEMVERRSHHRRRTPSREREQQQRSRSSESSRGNVGGRRLSQSPGRRSENSQSPATSVKTANVNRPGKMVSVPAMDKKIKSGESVGEESSIKRVLVKRNVSPRSQSPNQPPLVSRSSSIKGNQLRHRRNRSGEIELGKTEKSPYRRTPLSEIDTSTRSALNRSRSARRSRDLDMNPEISQPSTSYASFLLEDIRIFHQKNKVGTATAAAVPLFSRPPCVSKACSIVKAIADLNSLPNSNLNSLPNYNLSGGRKIGEGKDTSIDLMESNFPNYVTVKRGGDMEERESWESNSFGIGRGRTIPVVAAINST